MHYKEIVREYVESNDPVEMEMLTTLTDEFIHKVKDIKPELVDKYLWNLKMYLHPLKSRECAESIVAMFKNRDGSEGEHWDYDTTTKVLESKGYDFDACSWYWALNRSYSDYYNKEFSDSMYIELAVDFLTDPDSRYPAKERAERYIRTFMF